MKFALSGLVLLFALAFFARNLLGMSVRGPYPMHVDEGFIADSAWNIVKNRDPNPHFFRYGSLPIYLTAAAQGAAAWVVELFGAVDTLTEVEPLSHPYYAQPAVSFTPRVVFALLGSLTLCLVAMLGYSVKPSWEATLVPVVVLLFDPLFVQHAWEYVNVDILVSTLGAGALAYLCFCREGGGFVQRVLIPALFCGAALATKYNAGLLLLPCALAILLQRQRASRTLSQLAMLAPATALVFSICEPYALLDASTFWEHVQFERHHYQTGHPGNEGEPGLAQLRHHLRTFRQGYGWLASWLILIGIAHGFRMDRRRTLLLLAFPLASLGFMSLQRANFARNLLPARVCLSAFAGLGLAAVHVVMERCLSALAARWPRTHLARTTRLWLVHALSVILAVTILYSSKRSRPRGTLALEPPDTRTEAAAWFLANTPKQPCDLVVASQLMFNPISVRERCTVHTLDMTEYGDVDAVARRIAQLPLGSNSYIALPLWKENADFLSVLPDRLALGEALLRTGRMHMSLDRRRIHGDPSLLLYAYRRPQHDL